MPGTSTSSVSSYSSHYDFIFKVVVVGDSGVGKTNLLKRYTENSFEHDSKSTIGVEFATKTEKVEDKIIKAQIWDTAGQERFRALTNAYYRGASGALLVFDITKRASFLNCKRWLKDLSLATNSASLSLSQSAAETSTRGAAASGAKRCVVILVGNKADLEDKGMRSVSVAEATAFAKTYGIAYIETSACKGNNVSVAFQKLVATIYGNVKQSFSTSLGKKEHSYSQKPLQEGSFKKTVVRIGDDSDEEERWSIKKRNCCQVS